MASMSLPPSWWKEEITGDYGVSAIGEMRGLSGARRSPTLRDKLRMRMNWLEGDRIPFDALFLHQAKDRVLVFLVVNDEPVPLSDDIGLFPSDQLITQLRLLQNDKGK